MPRALTIPLASGTDPEIEDCREAYGESDLDLLDSESFLCDQSPSGQCEFSARDNHRRCIHCGDRCP